MFTSSVRVEGELLAGFEFYWRSMAMTLNIHEPLIWKHDLFVWKNSSQV